MKPTVMWVLTVDDEMVQRPFHSEADAWQMARERFSYKRTWKHEAQKHGWRVEKVEVRKVKP